MENPGKKKEWLLMNVTKFSKSRRSAVSAKRVVWTLMIQVHPSRAHTATAAFELALRSSVIAGTNTQIRLFIYHFVYSLCPSSFSKGKIIIMIRCHITERSVKV